MFDSFNRKQYECCTVQKQIFPFPVQVKGERMLTRISKQIECKYVGLGNVATKSIVSIYLPFICFVQFTRETIIHSEPNPLIPGHPAEATGLKAFRIHLFPFSAPSNCHWRTAWHTARIRCENPRTEALWAPGLTRTVPGSPTCDEAPQGAVRLRFNHT